MQGRIEHPSGKVKHHLLLVQRNVARLPCQSQKKKMAPVGLELMMVSSWAGSRSTCTMMSRLREPTTRIDRGAAAAADAAVLDAKQG